MHTPSHYSKPDTMDLLQQEIVRMDIEIIRIILNPTIGADVSFTTRLGEIQEQLASIERIYRRYHSQPATMTEATFYRFDEKLRWMDKFKELVNEAEPDYSAIRHNLHFFLEYCQADLEDLVSRALRYVKDVALGGFSVY